MRVDKMYRIKFPNVSHRGQQYMLLTKSEALEVYKDLRLSLGFRENELKLEGLNKKIDNVIDKVNEIIIAIND